MIDLMTNRTPHQTRPLPDHDDARSVAPSVDHERGDWFFDELMTPQPDAAQEFFRARLKALAKDAKEPSTQDGKPKDA